MGLSYRFEIIVHCSYRTHPANVACLTAANIHHVSLANNHTLDFGIKGLEQTSETLRKCNISYVGESSYSITWI